MRRLALFVLAGYACTAAAQLRTIPDDARRGVMSHVQETIVDIDGVQRPLTPGAQIRDKSNMIVMPAAVPAGTLVKYRLDREGKVRQVWFLTDDEAAQPDKASQ